MKINEVEAAVGVTKKNIRFYEEEGLITPGREQMCIRDRAYGVKAEAAGAVVRMVRDACKKPLMVKLSPQAENIPEMCRRCV